MNKSLELLALEDADKIIDKIMDSLYTGEGMWRYLPGDVQTQTAHSILCHMDRINQGKIHEHLTNRPYDTY